MPLDLLGRPLRDLRVSVTDRCNFRCRYCMPREVFGREYPPTESWRGVQERLGTTEPLAYL